VNQIQIDDENPDYESEIPTNRELKRGKYGYDLDSYCEKGQWG
jgi:hypothetical protein